MARAVSTDVRVTPGKGDWVSIDTDRLAAIADDVSERRPLDLPGPDSENWPGPAMVRHS